MKVTAGDIAQLLASHPPRRVPRHVVQAVNRGMGCGVVAGLIFVVAGLLGAAVFFPWRFQDERRLAGPEAALAIGEIREVEDAHMRINKVKVWRLHFTFPLPDGREQAATCYASRRSAYPTGRASVRYLPADPAVAIVREGRLTKGDGGGFFVLLFPLMGAGLVAFVRFEGRRRRKLLEEGLVAKVRVHSVTRRPHQRKNRTLSFDVVLDSPEPGGPARLEVVIADPREVGLLHQALAQGEPVTLLYRRGEPTRVILPDALIDADGSAQR